MRFCLLLAAASAANALMLAGWPRTPPCRGTCLGERQLATVQLCDGGSEGPPPADLADEVLVSIVRQEMPDQEVNELVWKYLGYARTAEGWDSSGVFPGWRKRFPEPVDLVGVTRTYTREVDEPVLRAVQALQKSVPREHKDRLRPTLKPLGWSGFKLAGLTPNMTRRAQVATWLLYYRTALHGVPLEELQRRKAVRAAQEEASATPAAPTGTTKQDVI